VCAGLDFAFLVCFATYLSNPALLTPMAVEKADCHGIEQYPNDGHEGQVSVVFHLELHLYFLFGEI